MRLRVYGSIGSDTPAVYLKLQTSNNPLGSDWVDVGTPLTVTGTGVTETAFESSDDPVMQYMRAEFTFSGSDAGATFEAGLTGRT